MNFQADAENSIRVERAEDGVVSIVLDRPQKKNALTQAMWRRLRDALIMAGEDPATRLVVISGAGADFCAGADIGEFDRVRGSAEAARAYEADNSAAFAAIRNCPAPTLAAISGICFGGGFGIAAACDLRIASADAMFSVPAARLGLAYPVDAMIDIVEAAGPQWARYLAYSAARIDATEARDAGFLLAVLDDAVAMRRRADAIAQEIAASAPLSVRASKASIRAVSSRNSADIARAVELGDATFESADYSEGRAAFRDRRRPRFTGR